MRHHHQRRSKGHSREGGDDRSGDCWVASVINQVIRGSKAATGLGKGPVITLFVLGFIFMPLLTGLVFFAMLFWTANPAKARESVDRFTDHVKRAGKHFTDATRGQPRPSRGATQPDVDLADDALFEDNTTTAGRRQTSSQSTAGQGTRATPRELRQRFESLEERARIIEAFVASEEYRLEREFDKMNKS